MPEPQGRLSEAERLRRLRIFDEYMAKPPTRPHSEVDAELKEIRDARRAGGRLTPVDPPPNIPGADTVVAHFGYWPTFHDAEVESIFLHRSETSRIVVKAFHMTRPEFEIIKRATVTFLLDGIVDGTTLIEGFNHQNVITGLFVNRSGDGFELALEWCFGVGGKIACARLRVEIQPN
jgi:hypothetical protein